MTTLILRCTRCWRDCAGVRCPRCGAATAVLDLGDSLGAAAVADQQHATEAARAAEREQWIAPSLWGDDDRVQRVSATGKSVWTATSRLFE